MRDECGWFFNRYRMMTQRCKINFWEDNLFDCWNTGFDEWIIFVVFRIEEKKNSIENETVFQWSNDPNNIMKLKSTDLVEPFG
jgi:hypothetical protein